MKDLFKNIQNAKETKNLKSWAVKLPEETIEELEKLFKLSGVRYKNEFIEKLLKEHKFQVSSEKEVENDSLIHPEILNTSANDLKEINRLTQNIRSVYINQAEKLSNLQHEIDKLKKENMLLKMNSSQTVINDHLLECSKKDIGNQIFLGVSGSGKTYAMGLEIKKAINQDKRIVIVDFAGEYKNLTEKFGGYSINLGKDCLNPFEFYTNDESDYILNEKIMDVLSFLELIFNRTITSQERNILLSAIEKTYNEFGFNRDEYSVNDKFPTLYNLEKNLISLGNEAKEFVDDLEPYTSGILSYFNGERKVDIIESPITHFDLHNISNHITKIGLYNTLEFIYMMIRNGLLNDSVIVLDETWMIQDRQNIHILQKILHYGNEQGIRFMISTQQTAEFYNNLDIILTYFDTTICFKQMNSCLNSIKENLDIENSHLEMLKTAKKGDCVVFSKNDLPFYMRYPEDKEMAVLLNPLLGQFSK